THAVIPAVIGRTYGPLLWLSGIGITGSAGTPTPILTVTPILATRVGTPIILIPMATRAVTRLIPMARGRISDSDACSIRRLLRFHTNTERRRTLPTNMKHRHSPHTTTRRRRGHPGTYPAPITTPVTSNNDNGATIGSRGRSRKPNTRTVCNCSALL